MCLNRYMPYVTWEIYHFERSVICLTNKQHDLSKLKHALYEQKRKSNGKKDFVYRKLTPEELEYLSGICKVEPHLFEIKKTFRPGFDVRNATGTVKSIYYAKRSPVYKALNAKQVAQCKNAGLKVIPYKYKIHLNTLQ